MRIPRVLLGYIVGAGLAVCGVIYQSLFKNPLASPYTLGVSSGAALGASIASLVASSAITVSSAGIVGALFSIGLIIVLGKNEDSMSPGKLLLSGVMLSFFFSGLILFAQYLGDFTAIVRLTRWLMGSVETVGYAQLVFISLFVILGTGIALLLATELSLLSLGEEIAASKGVDTTKIVWILFGVTSLMVGVIVSICGPVGFVGVAVPLAVRSLGAVTYRSQLVVSFLLGGILLTVCDALGRTLIAPAEIPVGVISALLGAPVVIALIRKETLRF